MLEAETEGLTTEEEIRKEQERVKEKIRQAGEDPEEWYIMVGLRKPLPDHLTLPEVYKGYKVFVEVVGEVIL